MTYPFPYFELVHCSMSGSDACFFTCIQISQETGNSLVFPSLEEFSTICCDSHSQRFSVVNEAEVDGFLEFPCFSMIQQMLAI